MKKKTLYLLSAFAMISNGIHAQVVYGNEEQTYVKSMYDTPISHIDTPDDVIISIARQPRYQLSGLADNWFVSLQGGFNSFAGNPASHTDFNGRTKFGINLSVGKWHSPYFGSRVTYQGFKFIDSRLSSKFFSNYHIDALLNISSFFRPSFDKPAKWNISPYLGVGIIRHHQLKQSSFAFSYGLTGTYSLSERINISTSIGGTTAHSNFDGYGDKGSWGDNLFSGSIGLTVSLGRLGWKVKNHKLPELSDEAVKHPTITNIISYPRNSYSGLRSLQERISNGNTGRVTDDEEENIALFDAPILFFFKRNSTELIDRHQLINIREIAAAVKEYDLEVRVVGSSDSKTGTTKHNRLLSIRRCRYIGKLLFKAGVPKSKVTGAIRGGSSLYKPYTANRHTCVMLYKHK